MHDTIFERSTAKNYFKAVDNIHNTETINRSGDYGNAYGIYPRPISEQYSPSKKEGWGKSSMYKFKSSQQIYFKMKCLHCLKYLLTENDFLGKTDLKDADFSVRLYMSSRKFVKLAWSGNLYEFLCL